MPSVKVDGTLIGYLFALLKGSDDLYNDVPLHLYQILRVVRVLWTEKYQSAFIHATLQIVEFPDFWSHLTRPLMIDLHNAVEYSNSAASHMSDSLWDFTSSISYDWNESIGALINAESTPAQQEIINESIAILLKKQKHWYEDQGRAERSSQQALVHSMVLQLLTLERHGLLFEKDIKVAVSANKKVFLMRK